MSDLISRSELLKRFLVNKDGHRIPERDCDNLEVTVSIKDVKTIIKEQPTAYDIDKIVEKLEKIRVKETCNKEKCDTKEICRICVVDDAIEIVKRGGVFVDAENMDSIKDKIEKLSKYAERQYNKAIDDLIAECENAKFAESDEISLSDVHTGVNSGLSMAIHFAEQLKVGGKNERSI